MALWLLVVPLFDLLRWTRFAHGVRFVHALTWGARTEILTTYRTSENELTLHSPIYKTDLGMIH